MSTRARPVTAIPRNEVRMILKDPDALQRLIKERGISQRGLARAIGLSGHKHINALVLGKRKSTSPKTALLIERWLNVPTGSLFVPKTSLDAHHIDASQERAA